MVDVTCCNSRNCRSTGRHFKRSVDTSVTPEQEHRERRQTAGVGYVWDKITLSVKSSIISWTVGYFSRPRISILAEKKNKIMLREKSSTMHQNLRKVLECTDCIAMARAAPGKENITDTR